MYIETLLRPVALAGTLRLAPFGSTGQSDGIAKNTCMGAGMWAAVYFCGCEQAPFHAGKYCGAGAAPKREKPGGSAAPKLWGNIQAANSVASRDAQTNWMACVAMIAWPPDQRVKQDAASAHVIVAQQH